MKDLSFFTLIFGSTLEACLIFFISCLLVGIKVPYKKIVKLSLIMLAINYFIFNVIYIPFGLHSIIILLSYIGLFNKFIYPNNKFTSIISTLLSFLIFCLAQGLYAIILEKLGIHLQFLQLNDIFNTLIFYPSYAIYCSIGYIIYKNKLILPNYSLIKFQSTNIIKIINRLVMFILIISVIFILGFSVSILQNSSMLTNNKIIEYILLFLLICLLIYVVYVLKKLTTSIALKEHENKVILENLSNINESISDFKKERHEYNKHLQIISSLIYLEKYNDVENYMQGISSNLIVNSIYYDYGNIYLNSIISKYAYICSSNNINFVPTISDNLQHINILSHEVCVILSNILDNSIDAVLQSSKNLKNININISSNVDHYTISIFNNGDMIYDKSKILEQGFSTKKGINRGYGLYNVTTILDKYNSNLYIKSDESLTEFLILIPKIQQEQYITC